MARSNNNNKLKAFVRFDGSGRIVPSSLIVQAFKPKVGNYQEIDAKECCNYVPPTTTSTTTVAPTTTTSTTVAPTTTTTSTTIAPTTTTTTTEFPGYYTWLMGRGTDTTVACAATPVPVYSSVSPLTIGVFLYTDTALTISVPNDWYAVGGVSYQANNGDGEIVAQSPCP